MVPALRPQQVLGAVLEPDAMDIDVHELHQAYLRLLRRRGGRLVTDAEVVALSHAQDAWTARTSAGDFVAPILVNAAGAWADRLAGLAGLQPIGLVPKRRTALTIAPPAGLDIGGWPMTLPTDSPDRTELGGRIAAEFPYAALAGGQSATIVHLDPARRGLRPGAGPRRHP